MENVVPGTLQRLRAADIIRMAGLATASVGQEYYRSGAVHSMSRRDTLLVGIVEHPPIGKAGAEIGPKDGASPASISQAHNDTSPKAGPHGFRVEVELLSPISWLSECSCRPAQSVLCVHAAALLYQWLAQPSLFQTQASSSAVGKEPAQSQPLRILLPMKEQMEAPIQRHPVGAIPRAGAVGEGGQRQAQPLQVSSLAPTENLQTLLSQSTLSELRAVAREYDLAVSGMSRQQLAESIQAELKKPDVVRRIATTLEKSQRQLLAALILAGGAMSDDDLRGLFERFSLGRPGQLQHLLLTLQNKALLFRTSLNASNIAQRGHHGLLNSALLDIGWYVPLEVRNALRVSVPVTPFDVTKVDEQGTSGAGSRREEQGKKLDVERAHMLYRAEASGPLSMLLLVARLLDGHIPGANETWYERGELKYPSEVMPYTRAAGLQSTDGSVPIPPPRDLPPSSLLQELQERIVCGGGAKAVGTGQAQGKVPVSGTAPTAPVAVGQLPFLRFIIRVLSVADLFHKGDGQSSALHLRSGTAERLLGTDWSQTLRTLFNLWLTQTSYGDLYDLNEEDIRLRCRAHVGQAHMLHRQPVLRSGELEAENSQARQNIVALLAQIPLNQWINFSSFARFVYRLKPLFLQQRQYIGQNRAVPLSPQWWLELEEGRPLRPLQLSDWLRAEFHYLRRMIAGPLHWWGVCDIVTGASVAGASPDLLAFRLTPMADWLFNGDVGHVGAGLVPAQSLPAQSLQAEEEGDYQQYVTSLEATEAGEILVSSSVQNWPLIQLLEMFTETAGVQQLQYPRTKRRDKEKKMLPSAPSDAADADETTLNVSSDLALAYRISAKAFGLALGRGLRPFLLLRLLRLAAEVKADSDPEQAQLFVRVATQFEQWLVGYGQVRLYTGVALLETVDTAVMREVIATTSLGERMVQNIHPTLCIVRPNMIGHIIDELKQRGQSPLLHDEDL